ncbi:MAG: type II toxin-antitoxin system VapC family toxin [Acidobacteriota bacterium]|jgi:PIN domain nuclease of toxin-antitoxin system|nr:type II toxin-antitoxin system VapC family toxin [Acidobacteriota bacterium]
MNLLLDTHIWLWGLLAPENLSPRVVAALQNPANELWLSPISTWELLVLCEKGRVALKEPVDAWLAKAFAKVPLKDASLTHAVALETRAVRLPHRDPADHFLVATARVYGLTLVTADRQLIRSRAVSILANR